MQEGSRRKHGGSTTVTIEQQQGNGSNEEAIAYQSRPVRRVGIRLFWRMLIYHGLLLASVVAIVTIWPGSAEYIPVGGVQQLVQGGELTVSQAESNTASANREIVNTMIRATHELDRLGTARQLILMLIGTWLLMLPIAWVHKGVHRRDTSDHSLDETVLILPGVVAAIVLVVQHSLALAFSLAGIVAGVQFRRALQDTFDALFILVAIGTGIAAGIGALEIAAVLTVFFAYSTLYVHYFGDGLQSDFLAQKKKRKQLRKQSMAKPVEDNANDQSSNR